MYRGDSIRGTHTGNQLYIPGGFHEASVRDEISRESSANLLNNDAWKDVPFANVNSFLEHTTPTILLRQLPKFKYWQAIGGPAKFWRGGTNETVPFFRLDELWESFGEWSVYGAGVPLVVPGEDYSCQCYYTPTLSALQLFEDSSRVRPVQPEANRRLESDDSSDAGCSESSDSDHEHKHYQFHESETSSEESHCDIAGGEEEGEEWRRCGRRSEKRLLFEYFERSLPHNRIPLSGQIAELQESHSVLKELRSIDLHPCSWFAVAWYPVYRIPNGPTLSDASASFLTYHSLSTEPVQGGKGSNLPLQVLPSQAGPVQGMASAPGCRSKLLLPAFGLASYKTQGAFWNAGSPGQRRKVLELEAGASEWLRQQNIKHPDFEWILSRGGGQIGR